jgi:hypothetical protein
VALNPGDDARAEVFICGRLVVDAQACRGLGERKSRGFTQILFRIAGSDISHIAKDPLRL